MPKDANLSPDEAKGTDSSTDATDAVAAAIGDNQDVDAQSSGASEADAKETGEDFSRESLMKAVRKAVGDTPKNDAETEGDTAGDDAGSPPAESQQDQTESKAGTETDATAAAGEEKADDDFSDVPFNKHPRFTQLIKKKNDLEAQVEELSKGADEWNKVSTFMQQNNLSQEAVGRMYLSSAKIGNEALTEICNYMDAVTDGRIEDALKSARQQVAELEVLSGHALSPELKRRIDDGLVDQDTALQLSQAESRLQLERRMNERRQEEQQVRFKATQAEGIQNAVREWESRVRANDPDYGLKQRFVHDRIALKLKDGIPSSQKEALEIVQGIYDEVSSDPVFQNNGRAEPKKTVTGGSSQRALAPEPKTMLEAVQRALQ